MNMLAAGRPLFGQPARLLWSHLHSNWCGAWQLGGRLAFGALQGATGLQLAITCAPSSCLLTVVLTELVAQRAVTAATCLKRMRYINVPGQSLALFRFILL
jgi:hypothetical protein